MFKSGAPHLPPPTPALCCGSTPLSWERGILCIELVFEIRDGKLKTGRRWTIWAETKCVNERRWFTSSTQANCYNNSGRPIELETDKSQDKAFGSGCSWSAEKAKGKLSYSLGFSFVNFLPPALLISSVRSPFAPPAWHLTVSSLSTLISHQLSVNLWDHPLFLVSRGWSCVAVAALKIAYSDRYDPPLLLPTSFYSVTGGK